MEYNGKVPIHWVCKTNECLLHHTVGLLISFGKVAENAEVMKDFCLLLQILQMAHEKCVKLNK